MANVTDSNSWRSLSLPAPSGRGNATPTHLSTSDNAAVPQWHALTVPPETFGAAGLSQMLYQVFDGRFDRILWNIATTPTVASASEGSFARVDPEHSLGNTEERALTSAANNDWVVVVDEANRLIGGCGNESLQKLRNDHGSRLLVIAYDREDSESEAVDKGLADELRLVFEGVVAVHDTSRLTEALLRIKRSEQAALLRLRRDSPDLAAFDLPEFESRWAVERADPVTQPVEFRTIASQELAERAQVDARIVAVSTAADEALLRPWQDIPQRIFSVESGVQYALQWSASLASGGSRPFAFVSWEELQNSFGFVRQDISLRRAGVTLIVESRSASSGSNTLGSASLAGIRQLPNTSILSPKNGAELRLMLQWCLEQQDPAVIWLPESVEPQVIWEDTTAVETGRAEPLRGGHDVAMIAWGPMVAAASAAAEWLLPYGIEATIVNARFAQPLDTETLVRATRDALYVVIVDDGEQPGGFGSWVLERLLHAGMTQPVSIVSLPSSGGERHPHEGHNQCAMRIVEQCRWLADPMDLVVPGQGSPDVSIVPDVTGRVDGWLSPPVFATGEQPDEHMQVLAQQFSPFIEEWVRGYEKVGSRDVYLWRWCLHGLELTTLSCVAPAVRQELCDTKLLAVMYGVMLDDVADQGGAEDFLNELSKIISGVQPRDFSRFSADQQAYARFTCDLWDTFEARLKLSPCYEEYAELLVYDHQQILNTMSYSCMVNRYPALLNVQEHDMYLPHNMQMMSFATMDLMCSPAFDRRELGRLREVIWNAQSMGRIGNLVSTWQREISDRDFTSGVFARALCRGDLTLEDLRSGSPQAIEAAIRRGGHELYFLKKWENHRRVIHAMQGDLHSVDVAELLTALQRLIHMELSSRGFK